MKSAAALGTEMAEEGAVGSAAEAAEKQNGDRILAAADGRHGSYSGTDVGGQNGLSVEAIEGVAGE